MTLTVTDLFCGAGGSAQGAHAVPGVEVRIAANHWQLAVDSHQENFPDTDHDCADISQVDVRRYPNTDILWASPECTNHSGAKGIKRPKHSTPDMFGDTLPDAAAERSRATMWDVPRFAEQIKYRAIVVENVVEAVKWVLFPAWLHAMTDLGYEHQLVSLNSMHAQAAVAPRAPQSRDRLYVVFHRRGDRRPEVTPRPLAFCDGCQAEGPAVQVWKRPENPVGRYRAQYFYQCARCAQRVEPYALPASSAIDWTMPGLRIGDRAKPLSPKTIARIEAGLIKYGREPAYTVGDPFRTRATRECEGVAFIAELRGGGSGPRDVAEPLATVVASGNHHMLVRYNSSRSGPGGEMCTPVTEPARTLTTAGHQSLVSIEQQVQDSTFRMLEPSEIQAAMAFRVDYRVLGNRRERVRQLGNAVTPPAAEFLLTAVAAALHGES